MTDIEDLLVAAYEEAFPPLTYDWVAEPDRAMRAARQLDEQRVFIGRLLATKSGQQLDSDMDRLHWYERFDMRSKEQMAEYPEVTDWTMTPTARIAALLAEVEGLRVVVREVAAMGACSQSHHSWISLHAATNLAASATQPKEGE